MPTRNFASGEWEITYGDTLDSFNTSGENGFYYQVWKKKDADGNVILDSEGNPQNDIDNYDEIFWDENNPDPKPSKSAVDAKFKELVADYAAKAYARNRKEEYDQLNQFELMTDDNANGTTSHKDAITAVKAKWPKDNSGPK